MLDKEPFFPYFCIFSGVIVLIVAAYSPQGKGQDAGLTAGASLVSGGLTAWGMNLKYGDKK